MPASEFALLVSPLSALHLVYEFHALRYPETHDSFQLSQPFQMPPEMVMLYPGFSVRTKAAELLHTLKPVADTLALLQQAEQRTVLVDYCQAQMSDMDHDVLGDRQHTAMLANQLLPPERIIRAMTSACRERRYAQAVCQPLETFIVSTSDPTVLPGFGRFAVEHSDIESGPR